ncbi:MAG: hypothetical protein WD827_06360 [Solirubrobacterales bacterium]
MLGAAAVAAALAIGSVAVAGTGQHGLEVGLRLTAGWAFPFLAAAYAAPAFAALRGRPRNPWLPAVQGLLWRAFAAIFAVHLVLIACLVVFAGVAPLVLSLLAGGLAYFLIGGIVLTSFDGFKAKLGSARVDLLQRLGEHWVFAVFTFTMAAAVAEGIVAWLPPLLVAVGIYAARLVTWRRSCCSRTMAAEDSALV